MTLQDFATFEVVHVLLQEVEVQNQKRKIITLRLRNTKNPFAQPFTQSLFNQNEIYEDFRPRVHQSNGGTLPDNVPETFKDSPFSKFEHAAIRVFKFPYPCYCLTKTGEFLVNARNEKVVVDSVKVLGMVEYIDQNGAPVWYADFDPQIQGERLLRQRHVPVQPNDDGEEQYDAQPPMEGNQQQPSAANQQQNVQPPVQNQGGQQQHYQNQGQGRAQY